MLAYWQSQPLAWQFKFAAEHIGWGNVPLKMSSVLGWICQRMLYKTYSLMFWSRQWEYLDWYITQKSVVAMEKRLYQPCLKLCCLFSCHHSTTTKSWSQGHTQCLPTEKCISPTCHVFSKLHQECVWRQSRDWNNKAVLKLCKFIAVLCPTSILHKLTLPTLS